MLFETHKKMPLVLPFNTRDCIFKDGLHTACTLHTHEVQTCGWVGTGNVIPRNLDLFGCCQRHLAEVT